MGTEANPEAQEEKMKSFRDPTDEWLKETIGQEADPMVTMLGKLTDKQYQFCLEYVKCGSPKKAAEKAKIPNSTNPSLLVHLPKIAACINILTAKREQELGKKSSAEIVERLRATPLVEAEDFGFSEATVKERETFLAPGVTLAQESADALTENMLVASDPAAHLMQLPKVKVPQAQSFGPQWVVERLVTIAERCMQIEPVYDRKGRPVGTFQFNAPGAIKALEMLGKTMALFRDKVEVAHELSAFSETELDARIKALVGEHPDLVDVVKTVEKEGRREH